MSEPGATRRPHSRRKNDSRRLKPLIVIGAFVAVIAPIAWILVQEPGGGLADESVPYVSREDDRYSTPSHEDPLADSTPGDIPSTAPLPSSTPSTPGSTPTPTPGVTPTGTPDRLDTETPAPTTSPTDRPTSIGTIPATYRPTTTPRPTSTQPTSGGTTKPTQSTSPTTTTPKPTPTETTRTPTDTGGMTAAERELFGNIEIARQEAGCAPLKRSTPLTLASREDAADRASSGRMDGGSASYAAVGANDMTAKEAMSRLLDDHSSTVLNCNFTTLGVGQAKHSYRNCLLFICSSGTRVSWVVDFT
ncbi:CAP domain-containing protein [Kribbella deserti]|uniref:CAP domain-containing protein n=1 Tax=Kribbella deserti TaxID=1926257 RepID=A0ABV6QRM3_9ACTN